MPRQISQKQIIDAILDGIEEAQKVYKQWSGGDWLGYTAEHVVSGFVARSIMEIPGPKFLEIEPRTKETVKAAGANKRGKLAQALRPGGHIDICLWWANNHPRAIIEIKHNLYNYDGQCKGDIERIKSSLRSPYTSLQFGVFAYFSSVASEKMSAKERLERRNFSIKRRIDDSCRNSFKATGHHRINENGNSAWAANCIVIKRARD